MSIAKGLKRVRKDGNALKIGIVRARWNDEVVTSLTNGCKRELKACGVKDENIIEWKVPGSYELPMGGLKMIKNVAVDAIVCIGLLIKGETMHFEYIAEAVTQGIMRLNLDYEIPIIFGVLCVLNLEQALVRAGLQSGGQNHGEDWGQGAVEMALLGKVKK